MAARLLLIVLLAFAAGCSDSDSSGKAGSQQQQQASTERGEHPIVSAHRGGAAYAPENTLLAMENAIRLGVDQLEADIEITADEVLVVLHDETLDRTTNCSGLVSEITLAELAACDAAYWFSPGQPTTRPDETRPHPLRGQGIQVPTVESLLEMLVKLGDAAPELSIEIKNIPNENNFDPVGTHIAEKLVPLIQQYQLQPITIVQSFWPASLDAVKRLDPTIRTQLLSTSQVGILTSMNLLYTTAGQHDIIAPNFDTPDLTAETVALAHGLGKLVIPYTPDTIEELESVTALGVDGLITNFPACLLSIQGRRGPGPATPGGVPATPDCL